MSENNINTVNVLSVDEERLKYRAIIHCSAVGARKGEFNILLPPPTAFANSNHYNQCVIKIDSFTATPFPGDDSEIAAWHADGTANLSKLGGIIIGIDVGSSQVVSTKVTTLAEIAEKGRSLIGGFKQFLPLQIVNTGTIVGVPGNPQPGEVQGPSPTPFGFSWTGIGSGIAATEGILAANPFGQVLTVRLIDPASGRNCYLTNAPADDDFGNYNLQISITMIPNDRSS